MAFLSVSPSSLYTLHVQTPSLAHPYSPHKQAHFIKQSQEALHMLTKPAQHIITSQHITAQHRELQVTGGALPAHTTHNSLLLTLENITECSVGRGCKRFGVLALMLQPTAPTRHVNYHETTAALCTYVAGVQVDLSSHSGLYRIVQTYVLCTPVCVHMVHEPQLLYSQYHKYIYICTYGTYTY